MCFSFDKRKFYDIITGQIHYRKDDERLSKVTVGENEPLEKALRRFKKKIEREGILRTLKEIKHYEKPSEKKRRRRKTTWKW